MKLYHGGTELTEKKVVQDKRGIPYWQSLRRYLIALKMLEFIHFLRVLSVSVVRNTV